jgi:NAD(P)-dependent dehydrogenase (short-subunit alcohol dehydrogenase family)
MPTLLIAGANRGIGLGLARAAAARGDTVIATARDPDRATDLTALGVEIHALDVTSDASVASLADVLSGRAIDALIVNSGVYGPDQSAAALTDFDGFVQTLAVNTIGPLRVVHALLPALRRATGGARVLLVSSQMGSMAYAKSNAIAYRTSKAALNKVAQGLATDLARERIAVAALHPGWVRTDMGGPHADLSVEESVGGILGVLDRMTPTDGPRFWNHDGRGLAW